MFTVFDLKWVEGLWDIACNQQAHLCTDVGQANSAQVEPQINIFLGWNIGLSDGFLGPGVEDWQRNDVVRVQVRDNHVSNKKLSRRLPFFSSVIKGIVVLRPSVPS